MPKLNHQLLIHRRTELQIEGFLHQPAHALLLIGRSGSGKYALARAVAANLLQLDNAEKLVDHPYYIELVAPAGKQEIPIDAVRALIHSLRLKVPGERRLQRIVIIDGAQNLSAEAQNALLKTLEEPGSDTAFLLTAPSVQAVAPTIVSRSQIINVYPINRSSALAFYGDSKAAAEIESNWRLSAGSPGLLNALLSSDADQPLKLAVSAFKTFLGSNTYQRLLQCDSLSKDKPGFSYFLDGGQRVLRVLHQNALKKGNANQAAAIASSRRLIGSLQAKFAANANPRLVATTLALNLKL